MRVGNKRGDASSSLVGHRGVVKRAYMVQLLGGILLLIVGCYRGRLLADYLVLPLDGSL
jgi:hypothetical protein